MLLPDFDSWPVALAWYNSAPLSLNKALKGKIVVIDFFTYCWYDCIPALYFLDLTCFKRELFAHVG